MRKLITATGEQRNSIPVKIALIGNELDVTILAEQIAA